MINNSFIINNNRLIILNVIIRSSSFLSRLKGGGSGREKEREGGADEFTGLKSLMYSMSKDKGSSDHLLLQDEGIIIIQ